MGTRKSLIGLIILGLSLCSLVSGNVVTVIGPTVDGETLLYSEVRSTVWTETPTNHTLVFSHLDRRIITNIKLEYEKIVGD